MLYCLLADADNSMYSFMVKARRSIWEKPADVGVAVCAIEEAKWPINFQTSKGNEYFNRCANVYPAGFLFRLVSGHNNNT